MASYPSPSRMPVRAGAFETEMSFLGRRFDSFLNLNEYDAGIITAKIRAAIAPILQEAAALDQQAAQRAVEEQTRIAKQAGTQEVPSRPVASGSAPDASLGAVPVAASKDLTGTASHFPVEAVLGRLAKKLYVRGQSASESFMDFTRLHKGSINASELRKGISDCGIFLSKDETQMILDAFDEDGSGNVDLSEFVDALDHAVSLVVR